MGGSICVDSTLGHGTEVKVYFPLGDKVLSEAIHKDRVNSPLPRGKKSILLVDDEQAILQMENRHWKNQGMLSNPPRARSMRWKYSGSPMSYIWS